MKSVLVQLALNAAAPVRALLDDPDVKEVMINGPDCVFVERGNDGVVPVDIAITAQQIEGIATNVAGINNKSVESKAIVSAKLEDLRFEIQMPPVAVDGPYITIRRHGKVAFTLEDYVRRGTLTPQIAHYLAAATTTRKNILVVGGTSTGKTTFLNALIDQVERRERLLLIETAAELIVPHKNIVRLEADDEQGYSAQRLLKSALRSRPDRIILGEARGGEAFDWLDAANTGHPGTFGSLHADSSEEGLDRLENLCLEGRPVMPHAAIRQRIGKTVDVVVHMVRVEVDGRAERRLNAVDEVHGFDQEAQCYRMKNVFSLNRE